MFLRLLSKLGVRKVFLAGLDGYSINRKNYFNESMSLVMSNDVIKNINIGMIKILEKISKEMDLRFITPSKYCIRKK